VDIPVFKKRYYIAHPCFSGAYLISILSIIAFLFFAVYSLYFGETNQSIGYCVKGMISAVIWFILEILRSLAGLKLFEERWESFTGFKGR
jgi:hypothetical protein